MTGRSDNKLSLGNDGLGWHGDMRPANQRPWCRQLWPIRSRTDNTDYTEPMKHAVNRILQQIVNIERFSHSLTHLCLEHVDLLDSAGVRLANDWDDVDLLVDLLHHLNIQGLEAVACGGDKVETGVHSETVKLSIMKRFNLLWPVVPDVDPLDPGLGLEVRVKPVLDILEDGRPALGVVHGLPEPWGVNYRQRELYSVLNQHSEISRDFKIWLKVDAREMAFQIFIRTFV